jgi:hypothetical protein
MTKDRPLRVFVIHLAIFVLVVSLLAALNLYRNPQKIWFVWVLAGWGIGLAAHDLALLLRRSGDTHVAADPKLRFFLVHLFVFITVNALIAVVNLLYSPGHYWFLYPLLGWGLVLAVHAYRVFYGRPHGVSA